jgi:hypothetical protein
LTEFSKTIQLISIWGILLPLIIGIVQFKIAGRTARLFVLFLAIGWCTDVVMYILQRTEYHYALPTILRVYSLIEALTFFWMIKQYAIAKMIRYFSKGLLWTTPVLWIIVMSLKPFLVNTSVSQLFDSFYEVTSAFLAGFVLLQIAEQSNSMTDNPAFWILLGIFFYCFCTFFLMGFLNTIFSQKIWFVNNIINIVSYIFYSIGLWQFRRTQDI